MIENIQLQFETNGNKSFTIYHHKDEDMVNMVELKMLRFNKIKGILPFNLVQKDALSEYCYDITSRISLEYMLRTPMTKEQVFKTFESICLCMENAADYLLDLDHFIVDMQYIFIDPGDGGVSFVYIPADPAGISNISFSEFLKKLLSGITYDVKGDTDFYIKTINYLNNTNQIMPKALRNKLYEFMKIVKPQSNDYTVIQPAIDAPEEGPVPSSKKALKADSVSGTNSSFVMGQAYSSKDSRKEEKHTPVSSAKSQAKDALPPIPQASGRGGIPPVPQQAVKEKKSLFGNKKKGKIEPIEIQVAPELILPSPPPKKQAQQIPKAKSSMPERNMVNEIGGTVLMEEVASYRGAYMENKKTGERILLTKESFAIGRNPDYVDYVVNSPTVGRLHLQIIQRDTRYYVIDINSKNGTFINKNRIQSNIEEPVHSGDIVQIGAEEFYFYCD